MDGITTDDELYVPPSELARRAKTPTLPDVVAPGNTAAAWYADTNTPVPTGRTPTETPSWLKTQALNVSSHLPIVPYFRNAAAWAFDNPDNLSYTEMGKYIAAEEKKGNEAYPRIQEKGTNLPSYNLPEEYSDPSLSEASVLGNSFKPTGESLKAIGNTIPTAAAEVASMLPWAKTAQIASDVPKLVALAKDSTVLPAIREAAAAAWKNQALKATGLAAGTGLVEGSSRGIAQGESPGEAIGSGIKDAAIGTGLTIAGTMAPPVFGWLGKHAERIFTPAEYAENEARRSLQALNIPKELGTGETNIPNVQLSTAQTVGSDDALHMENTLRNNLPTRTQLQANEAQSQKAMQTQANKTEGLKEVPGSEDALHRRVEALIDPGSSAKQAVDSAASRLGVAENSGFESEQALRRQASLAGKENYAKGYDHPLILGGNSELKDLLSRPNGRQALFDGVEWLRNDPDLTREEIKTALKRIGAKFKVLEDGSEQVQVIGTPSWQLLHYARQALDQRIRGARLSALQPGGNGTSYYSLAKLRSRLDGMMKEMNPDLAMADAVHSDIMANVNALEAGRDLFTATARESDALKTLTVEISNFTPSQLQAFRTGGVQALRDLMSRASSFEAGETGVAPMRAVQQFLTNQQQKNAAKILLGDQFEPWLKELQSKVNIDPKIASTLKRDPAYGLVSSGKDFRDVLLTPDDPKLYERGMSYLNRDAEAMQSIRDTMGGKFKETCVTTDTKGNPIVDYSKVGPFLDSFKHVYQDGRVFDSAQRELISEFQRNAQLLAQTPQEKMSWQAQELLGKNYISTLMGADAGSVVSGGHLRAAARLGVDVINEIFSKGRTQYINLLGDAMANPKIAKALLSKPSPEMDKRLQSLLAPYLKPSP